MARSNTDHELQNQLMASDLEKLFWELRTTAVILTAKHAALTIISYVHFEQLDGCLLDYRRMDRYLKDMHERYKESFLHPFLKPIKTTFMYV